MSAREWLTRQFELSRGGTGHNVRSMEGLRGFAVFLVFMVHYATLVNPWVIGNDLLHAFSSAVHTMGNAGVDLFFVLSGYLIYGSLISRPQKFMRFMSRRVKRIYPAFMAVFLLYVFLSFVFHSESKIPVLFSSAAVYLMQNVLLLPGLFPIEPLVTVSWSLSYEMFYYLAIPLVIVLLDLRQRSAKWRVTFFALVAMSIAFYCAVFGGHVRLIMFVSGIL
ncbi:MAG: acyltransferase, partial [Burkholderiales bacterium 21-58-4]